MGITAWREATCITWPPEDDGTRRFPMAFCGERTLVVGRPGVRAPSRPVPLDAALLEGDDAQAGGDHHEVEAGQPPLGRPACQVACWRGGDDRESAIGIGPIILRMLLVVTLWDDLVGADGVELSMAAECGVLGED